MPTARDKTPVLGQIVVEPLCEGQARVGAPIDVAVHLASPANGEPVEATRLHLEDEVPRRAVRDQVERSKIDIGGR